MPKIRPMTFARARDWCAECRGPLKRGFGWIRISDRARTFRLITIRCWGRSSLMRPTGLAPWRGYAMPLHLSGSKAATRIWRSRRACSRTRNLTRAVSIQDLWRVCLTALPPRRSMPAMADVQLVETSLRDGNQSLWAALGVNTAKTLAIAPVMDRVGFKAIDFTTSTHMGVAVRYKKEDPWERIRLMAKATPNTPLQFLSTGFRFISWETASPEFMKLAFATLVKNGMRRFALADQMNNADSNIACARTIKQVGGEYVIAALVFTISPIHDDADYVEHARKLAASPDVDALYIKDPGGLLTPLRARTMIPAVKAVIGDKPLELHSHCTIGLGELVYMDAPNWGVGTVHCASGAASDGISNPPAGRVVANLRELGQQIDIDDQALAEVGSYFTRLAEAEGLPAGCPQPFDATYF